MEKMIKRYYERKIAVPTFELASGEEINDMFMIDENGEIDDGAVYFDATFTGVMSYLDDLTTEDIKQGFRNHYGNCLEVAYIRDTNEYALIVQAR
jgi:hypothetical protein